METNNKIIKIAFSLTKDDKDLILNSSKEVALDIANFCRTASVKEAKKINGELTKHKKEDSKE